MSCSLSQQAKRAPLTCLPARTLSLCDFEVHRDLWPLLKPWRGPDTPPGRAQNPDSQAQLCNKSTLFSAAKLWDHLLRSNSSPVHFFWNLVLTSISPEFHKGPSGTAYTRHRPEPCVLSEQPAALTVQTSPCLPEPHFWSPSGATRLYLGCKP